MGSRSGGGKKVCARGGSFEPLFETPPPPFWAWVTGTPDGPLGRFRGGPEVPQHIWLKMIPTMR